MAIPCENEPCRLVHEGQLTVRAEAGAEMAPVTLALLRITAAAFQVRWSGADSHRNWCHTCTERARRIAEIMGFELDARAIDGWADGLGQTRTQLLEVD